ncbi:MAG: BamA/TamA family outer membrane protein [Paludibacteraceae bacterium]|nr:BamA/TamA family outer membrane protein [Paludibacteraceae bacterium]
MKRIFICAISILFVLPTFAAKKEKVQQVDSLGRKIKTGWNFGVLPSVAFDADLGFQGGALTNIYYYGDGSQYPEYIHSIYAEAAYTTKNYGIFRVNYDSKYLIPKHRLTLDATYQPDAMCDFYGFNGYQSIYNQSLHKWNKNPEKMDVDTYQSRAFYKYKRNLFRFAADIEGTIWKNIKWNAGVGVLGYMIGECDIDMLNGKHKYELGEDGKPTDSKAMNPAIEGLYEKYVKWGLIDQAEAEGGWHPYVRLGLTYDSRDQRTCPTKGIYADAFFTYTAAFGKQAAAGYNHLQFNFNFRHYVPVYRDRVTFAYRIGTQNNIAGQSPFYMNTYLNTLFIQRVMYEGLGGANSLRGIMRNRILANGFAYANVELRCKVAKFDIGRQHFYIGLAPFFDLGVITQPYELDEVEIRKLYDEDCVETAAKISKGENAVMPMDFDKYFKLDEKGNIDQSKVYMPHMAAGLGLKAAMNENFVLSVDWAMALNKQDNAKWANFYIKMGYLF